MSLGSQSRAIGAAVREPLVHFLILGAAIYGVYAGFGPGPAHPERRIVISASEAEWLISNWEKSWNRAATPEERAGLIESHVRETILYREALAMGLDRDDTIVRRRLAQKLEFLSQDLVAALTATQEELRAYFEEHAERFAQPALTSFTQVFIDADKRGERALADAAQIAAELRDLGQPNGEAPPVGDAFLLQASHRDRSDQEIATLFGAEFARAVAALEPGGWRGPLVSGYGLHFVYIERRSPAQPARFEAVRERVRADWERERSRSFDAEYYQRLRARYDVIIETPEPSRDFAATPEREP